MFSTLEVVELQNQRKVHTNRDRLCYLRVSALTRLYNFTKQSKSDERSDRFHDPLSASQTCVTITDEVCAKVAGAWHVWIRGSVSSKYPLCLIFRLIQSFLECAYSELFVVITLPRSHR